MSVSRETQDKLSHYAELIRKWNPRINLVAANTLIDLEDRHIQDSLQLVSLASAQTGSWLDIGSGGGLPGLVVAIARPDLAVTLIESDQRKATFLRTVLRETGISNAQVLVDRIENAEPQSADNVSARALAPLPLLMSYVNRHIHADGKAWLMKGRNWKNELELARQNWVFNVQDHPSSTEQGAAILEITRIRHV